MKYSTEKSGSESKALIALVDDFTNHMKYRLLEKLKEGYTGWDSGEAWQIEDIREKIIDRMIDDPTEFPIDIANYAMFWWNLE